MIAAVKTNVNGAPEWSLRRPGDQLRAGKGWCTEIGHAGTRANVRSQKSIDTAVAGEAMREQFWCTNW